MKLRQSQDDRGSAGVLASAAPVSEWLDFCKLRPAFVASRFKLSIENHRLMRGSRAYRAKAQPRQLSGSGLLRSF